ncbi:MAG: hypothetical protein KOO60_13565 [Gemmatimonadales bacterium]|nr:hypothetical protein [Gemmatimonadales bacterium]
MKFSRIQIVLLGATLMGCLFHVATLPGAQANAVLTQVESDGYLQWLHSLERTITGRETAGKSETGLLFPFDLPGWGVDEAIPYRHLAISKALGMVEAEFPDDSRREIDSSFVALSTARNYMNLSEYDTALVWFELAADLDKEGHFRRDIGKDRLGAAVAAGDSLALVQLTTNILGSSDLSGRAAELTLVYRWLLVQRDFSALDLMIKKMEGNQELLTDRLLFWHAYSLAWRKEYQGSLDYLRPLIQSGGLSRDLTESQRTWVLGAIPDLLFLLNHGKEAQEIYQILAGCSIPFLDTWGVYQVANLDFLSARYQRASQGFASVCERKRTGSFQDQACVMAQLALEISRIQERGEPYGAKAFYTP